MTYIEQLANDFVNSIYEREYKRKVKSDIFYLLHYAFSVGFKVALGEAADFVHDYDDVKFKDYPRFVKELMETGEAEQIE